MKFKETIKDRQLVITATMSGGEKINDLTLQMFQERQIRGFLKARKASARSIEYIGPEAVSLFDFLEQPCDRKTFYNIVGQIVMAAQNVHNYRIATTKVVRDLQHIYIQPYTRELLFLYVPIQNINFGEQFLGLIQDVANQIQLSSEADREDFEAFCSFLKGSACTDEEAVEKYIKSNEPELYHTVKGQTLLTKKEPVKPIVKTVPEDTMDTIVELPVDEDPDTIVGVMHYPSLYRVSTGETILIDRPVFRLGRLKTSDYRLEDLGISRTHADIEVREGGCYVIQREEHNRTYHNGRHLMKDRAAAIREGDRLMLAHEEFIFHE